MSTGEMSVSVYDRISNPMEAMVTLGKAIAESQMFGCSNISQGIVLAWECLTSRESSLSLAKKNHIIDGKLSMKADAMLAQFEDRGGKYEILSRTPDLAAIQLARSGKQLQKFELSWEQAQLEPFPYSGKEKDIVAELEAWKENKGPQPKLKTKYRTPRARMQMLWARVVSDAVRAVDPGVNYGRYTPEELDDSFSTAIEQPAAEKKSAMEIVRENAAATVTTPARGDDVVDASFTVVSQMPTQPADDGQYCTADQVAKIRDLFLMLQIDGDTQGAILAKRKVNGVRSLTAEQATELIAKLEERLAASTQPEPVAMTQAAPTQRHEDPATADQVAAIKTLLTEIEQREPGTVAKVSAKIKESGLQKLADLTFAEARILEQALQVKNLATFFDAALKGFKPGN
jgi:hypothetical protein